MTQRSRKCGFCKENVRDVDDDDLCFQCEIVLGFLGIIVKETDLDTEDAFRLVKELHEYVMSKILERLVDRAGNTEDFVEDAHRGMGRVSLAVS